MDADERRLAFRYEAVGEASEEYIEYSEIADDTCRRTVTRRWHGWGKSQPAALRVLYGLLFSPGDPIKMHGS